MTGRTRGRKKGSGKGEVRKAADEYSTNAATQKSQNRRHLLQLTNPLADDVRREKQSFATKVSRALSKWKDTSEFKAIPEDERDAAIKSKRAEMKTQLYVMIFIILDGTRNTN